MTQVVLVIHLMLAVTLVGVILMQRSEGGGLGIGGGGMSGLMTGRSTANLLTRATAILAACFMATSIILAMIANERVERRSILDTPAATSAPVESEPAAPASPSVPASQ